MIKIFKEGDIVRLKANSIILTNDNKKLYCGLKIIKIIETSNQLFKIQILKDPKFPDEHYLCEKKYLL